MGSGLSMTSVNKIKELAAAREYSLALEIIDSQDLSKSLNPQFIRLCGDVYIANKRYKDARKVLLMAHRMAPEAKRVIYSLVDLYLRMGYKDLADFYYKLYMFDAEPNLPQTNHLNYIYSKAQECPFQEIETLLFPMYSDVMDYDWSFELYLLMKIQGKEEEASSIKADYIASYKNEPNVLIMEELERTDDKLEELFYIYSKETVPDDSPEQEDLRQQEQPLLEADELRMNPKEAEIQILFDDNEKATFGAKLKYKKHMKEQEKLAKKAAEGELSSEEDNQVSNTSDESGFSSEGVLDDNPIVQDDTSGGVETGESASAKLNIFKKLFTKKKDEDNTDGLVDDIENYVDDKIVNLEEDKQLEDIIKVVEDETIEKIQDSSEETYNIVETEVEESQDKFENDMFQSEVIDEVEEDVVEEADETEVDATAEEYTEQESLGEMGDSDMQEIYGKKKLSILSELEENSFADAEDLEYDFEAGNPFDEITINRDEEPVKTSYVVEEAQLQPEDDGFEVDDFSQDVETTGFSDEFDFDFESEHELETGVEVETEFGSEIEIETGTEVEIETESEVEIEYESEVETEYESEVETEYESEVEIESESEVEAESDEDIGIESVAEADIEELDVCDETESVYVNDDNKITSILEGESVYNTLKEKGRMEFPEFKSTLFPEYGQEVVEVENNFDEIMTSAQDKINENLMKEEQMQREAEALLASLGIDLGSIKPTINPEDAKLGFGKRIENTSENKVSASVSDVDNKPQDVPEKVDLQVSDSILESLVEPEDYYRPSRDELKASLKIDSVKKSILKQIKEYR